MEMWQSPVYCNSLENCRVERLREFESHRFRQTRGGSSVGLEYWPVTPRVAGSSPVRRATLIGELYVKTRRHFTKGIW